MTRPTAGLVNYGGWWERPAATMTFDVEPTAASDDAAEYMREWYEANRETWWQRRMRNPEVADDFMLSMLGYARLIQQRRSASEASTA